MPMLQIEVLPSAGEGNGSFISSELAAGKTVTHHAGDTLDLKCNNSG